ncbi:unnamed protein product [Soboliphyme baturini]|uniref:39S ribosomal protein L30, mitochondrial n=1 Tax=Soboliphyme baturini TaxID=241478 RepID=A0A183J4M1_9BILA|nr:unnamed protein product [Soboliphyme baturini]
MARVPRSCFVYKPLHKYRYLPRPAPTVQEFDYAAMQSGPEQFEEHLEQAPKLWVAWMYAKPKNEPYWIKRDLERLFGPDPKPLEMKVFKNTPYWNGILWKVKHLIEVKAINFVNGEPSADDVPHVMLLPNGQCTIGKETMFHNRPRSMPLSEDPKQLDSLRHPLGAQLILQADDITSSESAAL